jgi:hypothetical protein
LSAVKDLHAEFLLEFLNHHAQRWLAHMAMVSGPGMVPVDIQGYNVFKLLKVHSFAPFPIVFIDKFNKPIVNIDIAYIVCAPFATGKPKYPASCDKTYLSAPNCWPALCV